MQGALSAGPGRLDVICRPTGESEEGFEPEFVWEELYLRKRNLAGVCEMVQSWAMGKVELERPARRQEGSHLGSDWGMGRGREYSSRKTQASLPAEPPTSRT